MKKLATVSMSALMIALLVGLVVTPVSAQNYPPTPTTPPPTTTPPPPTTTPPPPTPSPPGKPTCGLSDTTISPGDQVTVSGKHWQPGSTVAFSLRPEDINLGSTTVGGNGQFSAVVTIPTSVEPGAHTIVCSGIDLRGDPAVLGIDVQILGVVGGGGGAAFTGTVLNVPLWMLLIAALFAAGVVVFAIGRRRRRSVGTVS